jgi:hypothetical protein
MDIKLEELVMIFDWSHLVGRPTAFLAESGREKNDFAESTVVSITASEIP